MTVAVSPLLVGRVLNLVVGVLLAGHFVGQYSTHILGHPSLKGLVPLFNMNGELSIAAWLASMLFVACTALLAAIASGTFRAGAPHGRWWTILSLISLYLAVDEAVAIHELIIEPFRRLFGVTEGWLFFGWVIPAGAVVALFALAAIPFLRDLPADTRHGLLLGAALFLGGALAVEMVSGWYLSTRGDDFQYEMIGGFEELLEFEGLIVTLTTLMAHYGRAFGRLALCFETR